MNPGPSDCKAKRLAITLWAAPSILGLMDASQANQIALHLLLSPNFSLLRPRRRLIDEHFSVASRGEELGSVRSSIRMS